jgi:beta-glucosidase-like glycosyl hydrolase
MNYYGHIIARLDGDSIEDNLNRNRTFVKKGIAGFIIFGGELEAIREYIGELQALSHAPLIIASDLEQGLGQQILGGTLFPPAMALSSAVDPESDADIVFLQDLFTAYAEEALYAGINTILAPVVDINTNHDNPVISVRSFGENQGIVSVMAGHMIETVQSHGVIACAKHFPGHGDTDVDSHIGLPVINKDLVELDSVELEPFRSAISNGVWTMMLGHIACPALDEKSIPVSVSKKAVDFIRKVLRFNGLLMTDAMNMGGLSSIGQNEAGLMALTAGVDILLHPDDPDVLNGYLKMMKAPFNPEKVALFRNTLRTGSEVFPDFDKNRLLSSVMTERSIKLEGEIRSLDPSSIVVIRENDELSSGLLEKYMMEQFPQSQFLNVTNGRMPDEGITGYEIITIIFSTTAAWKGTLPQWFIESIRAIKNRTELFIVFGNPYVVHKIDRPKILAWWCSEHAERAVAKLLDTLMKTE